MKYTQVAADAFKKLQMNAGVLLTSFDPATGEIDREKIIAATGGGVNFTATPAYTDFAEDIDNVPNNTKEMKRLDSVEVKISGTAKTADTATAKLFMGAADVDDASGKVTPRADLALSDFQDIWWVGDYSDVNSGGNAGFMAIRMMNALNTGGFSIQSNDKGKGDFTFEFTGHYSLEDVSVVPYEVWVKAGVAADATLAALTIGSLTLDPEFDPSTTEYTATTSNASNVVTATAADDNAVVSVAVNGTAVAIGSSATWQNGENELVVTVTNGSASIVYTVTVTKE